MSATPDLLGTDRPAVWTFRRPTAVESLIDLSRVQALRIVRHPALLLSVVWLVVGIGFGLPDTPYEKYSAVTGLLLLLLGPATYFAANLVASSERRSGADEWTPALAMPQYRRTLALLGAGVVVAAGVLVADLLLLAITGFDGIGMAVRWTHVVSVPVVVLGGIALGVAVARLLPWPGAPLVVMASLVAANLWTSAHQPYLGFYVDFVRWTDTDAIPAFEPGSGGWHLVYLLAFVGLAAFGAVLRDVRRRWVPVLGGGVCAVLVVVAGALQL